MSEDKNRPLTQQELAKVEAETEDLKTRTVKTLGEIEKLAAEKAKLQAEVRKVQAEADDAEAMATIGFIGRDREVYKREKELQSDEYHRVYRFNGPVMKDSVDKCIERLSVWNRMDGEGEKSDITLVINSPGGGIIEGFALWDFLHELKESGHYLTTIARGYAASMGGILLQAGDKRIMGTTASLLIHEAQFGAHGSFGEVEDEVEFVKKLQDRILDIFAARSVLTKTQIKNRWHRKNWWMLPSEALKFGFIDEIGGGGVV